MNRSALAALTCVSIVAILPLLLVGCNKDQDIPADAFRVTPESATLAKSGDSVVLQAVGGLEPFAWSLSDTNIAMGTVSGNGRTVTFTRGTASGANKVQVTDDRTWTASATIYLDATTSTTVSADALAISPTSVTLSDNRDTAVFIATGGTEPYTWSLADSLLGHINTGSGAQIVYTRDRPGNNTVILTDGSNNVKVATVIQPDDTTVLSISPPSATLANNGDTTVFLAVGGTAPYTWQVADGTRGHLSANSGNTVVYTRDTEGDNSVVLTDRYGNTAVAAVTQGNPDDMTISPASASLSYNTDTVVFVANGGLPPYHWSVADTSRGELNNDSGASVIYTRLGPGDNTVTLRDNDSHVATATVTQPSFGLAVTPSSATLVANGDSVVLVVSGGLPPFSWELADYSRGRLSADSGSPVTYTRLTNGNNSVVLSDASGQAVVAAISQPAVPPLVISPPTASVSTNSGTQVFTASGGLGTYTWSVVTPSPHGAVAPSTGASTVYISTLWDPGTDIIKVTDGPNTTFATVTKH
jgi:hypothetical protein